MIDAVLANDPIAADGLLVELEATFEERIVDCMAREGFEYRAADNSEEMEAAALFYETTTNGPDPAAPISSGFRVAFEMGLFGQDADPGISDGSEFNRDYTRELDSSAQVAYAASLDQCYDAESSELDSLLESEELATSILFETEERLRVNAEYVKIVDEWFFCMSDTGISPLPQDPQPETVEVFLYQSFIGVLSQVEDPTDAIMMEPALDSIESQEEEFYAAQQTCFAESGSFDRIVAMRGEMLETVRSEKEEG